MAVPPLRRPSPGAHATTSSAKLGFNADLVAIGLALLMAALVRFNVVHHIGW